MEKTATKTKRTRAATKSDTDAVPKKASQYRGKEKKIIIKQTENGLYFAKYEGGGELPSVLGGVWTNANELQGRINRYKESR